MKELIWLGVGIIIGSVISASRAKAEALEKELKDKK